MSYHPPAPPPPGYPTHQPPPVKKTSTGLILGIVGGVLALCCGGAGIIALAGDPAPDKDATARAVAAPAVTATTQQTSPPPLDKPETAAPEKVAMPDVRDQNAAVAQDHLEKLGFTNITFGSADELDTWVVLPQNWTVTKQSTKPGRKIATDTLIVLTCTKVS